MSDNQNVNRKMLTELVNLVKPALATAAYIPALTHIRFADGLATAYNDVAGIQIKAPVEIDCCLPGDLLSRSLTSFNAEHVAFQQSGSDVVMKAGRSKVTMPSLSLDQFPFDLPGTRGQGIEVSAAMLKGIDRCLISVGNDPTHPAQMGITLDVDDNGHAVLFSTDNFSISRYQTNTEISLPGDSPVILPTFFCNQLLSLSKAFPQAEIDLFMVPGAVVATFDGSKAKLFTKIMVDLEPLDFPRIVADNVTLTGLKDRAGKLPDAWEGAIQRALLVTTNEVDKVTQFKADGEVVKLTSRSPVGEAVDTIDLVLEQYPSGSFFSDPSLVARASKACALIEFGEKTMVMADADAKFVHLIAHCSK